jgi:hypothetical protein
VAEKKAAELCRASISGMLNQVQYDRFFWEMPLKKHVMAGPDLPSR